MHYLRVHAIICYNILFIIFLHLSNRSLSVLNQKPFKHLLFSHYEITGLFIFYLSLYITITLRFIQKSKEINSGILIIRYPLKKLFPTFLILSKTFH